jgi:5-formyltetrahydrofolate cyclo-ligase
MDLGDLKAALRTQVRAELAKMTVESRTTASAQARAVMERQSAWQNAASVLFFAPMPQELDVWPMLVDALAAGKTVALPRFDPEAGSYVGCQVKNLASDLVAGRFGIREPKNGCAIVPLNRLDFVLVPGVAFDLHGRRLGQGRGFYDQLLAAVRGRTCGVAFDEQIVREVPVEPHDICLNCILTPTRWIEP